MSEGGWRGFFQFYWMCSKHLGRKVWDNKGAELASAVVLTVVVLFVSWMMGQKDAFEAFEIGMFSLVGWLAVFAIRHLALTPVLLSQKEIETKALRERWWVGIGGIAIVIVIGSVPGSVAWYWYAGHNRPMVVTRVDETAKDAEIVQCKARYEALAKTPAVRETRQLTPAQQLLLRKLVLNYLNYSGPKYPNDAFQQPVTLQWVINDDVGQAFVGQLNDIFPKSWKGKLSAVNKEFWKKSVGSSAKGIQVVSNARTYQVLALEDLFANIGIHAKVDIRFVNVQPIKGILVAVGAP